MFCQSISRWLCRTTAIMAAITLFTGCDKSENNENGFNDEDVQKISESMGHFVVENLNAQNLSLDIDSFIKGIKNAKSGVEPPLSKQEFNELLTTYRKKSFELKGSENLKLSEDFLEDNEKDPQVIVLENGKLQYKVLEKGTGDVVSEGETPLIYYEGKFIDGKVFDSTEIRGNKPIPLTLKTTIPGFRLGVAGMKVGEKRRLFIHPELGYGNSGRFPPNSLLIFDIEIVEVETKKPEPPKSQETEKETKETSMSWLKRWTGA